MKKNFDLFVIGGGSGGVRAARVAASKGLKVGLAEGWNLGGTCVNRGCVPKKLYSYASHFNEEVEIMQSFGWKIENINFSWQKLVFNKKKEITRLNNIYKSLLSNSGVETFDSYACFKNNSQLLIEKKSISFKRLIIAVGGRAVRPNIPGSELMITSDEIFDIEKLPKKILIIGGGYIAVEFASIFNGLGVDTTICIRSDKILRGFDEECTFFLKNEMKKKGIKFINRKSPEELINKNNELIVRFDDDELQKFNMVMAATGRKANIEKLKLQNTDIKIDSNGSIIVNDFFESSCKNIYAIGDVIDRVQLTPVAISEAMLLISNIVDNQKNKHSYKDIPTAIFSNPNMAFVGLNEELAKKKFQKIEVYVSEFKPLKLSMSSLNEKVFIKLIVDGSTKDVLGLCYVGNEAAEVIQGFAVAILKGIKKEDLDRTIGIHPSSAEEIVTLKQKR